ncbi:hypothetical protein BB561_003928 [Smittium simulii]|uniref:RING-type domain-containing protein n=1 Tax=Smittium simulii TaxID=133385 RepID=A0A2T9YJ06_9FUNG|nr:hypothetical protein BB561_003928 [Smittium simulii]
MQDLDSLTDSQSPIHSDSKGGHHMLEPLSNSQEESQLVKNTQISQVLPKDSCKSNLALVELKDKDHSISKIQDFSDIKDVHKKPESSNICTHLSSIKSQPSALENTSYNLEKNQPKDSFIALEREIARNDILQSSNSSNMNFFKAEALEICDVSKCSSFSLKSYTDNSETDLDFRKNNNHIEKSKKIISKQQLTDSQIDVNTEINQSQESPNCPICYENFSTLDSRRTISLACGHAFCKKCIYKWFGIKNNINKTIYSLKIKIPRKPCPKCNRLSSYKDFRAIFPTCLIAVDENKIEILENDLEKERVITFNQRLEISKINNELKTSIMEKNYLRSSLTDLNQKLRAAESKILELNSAAVRLNDNQEKILTSTITYYIPNHPEQTSNQIFNLDEHNIIKNSNENNENQPPYLNKILLDLTAEKSQPALSDIIKPLDQTSNEIFNLDEHNIIKNSNENNENQPPYINKNLLDPTAEKGIPVLSDIIKPLEQPSNEISNNLINNSNMNLSNKAGPDLNQNINKIQISTTKFNVKYILNSAHSVATKHAHRDIYFICKSKSDSHSCKLICVAFNLK